MSRLGRAAAPAISGSFTIAVGVSVSEVIMWAPCGSGFTGSPDRREGLRSRPHSRIVLFALSAFSYIPRT